MSCSFQTIKMLPMQYSEVSTSKISTEKTSLSTDNISVNVSAKSNHYKDIVMHYDEIWSKLMIMCKKLHSIMNEYNAQRQAQAWTLDVNALNKIRLGIEKNFQAAIISAGGDLANGMCSIGGMSADWYILKKKINLEGRESTHPLKSNTVSKYQNLGRDAGQLLNSICAVTSSSMAKEAEKAKVEAEFMSKSARSYEEIQYELQIQAGDIMKRILELGQRCVERYNQALHQLMRS